MEIEKTEIKENQSTDGPCGKKPVGPTPTPNGSWVCNPSTRLWEWVEDIG